MGNVRRVQDGIKKLWTGELYSEQFKNSPVKHKDFDHALKHVLKAAVRLLERTEESDHSGATPLDAAFVEKYVADLVICAVRLANVNPSGPIDLENAIFDRIESKMGARLEREADGEEKRLIQRIRVLRTALWEKIKMWNDSHTRDFMMCSVCGVPEDQDHLPPCPMSAQTT